MPKLAHTGFTLVELLIAVSILSLISVVAIPNLRKFNQDQDVTLSASNLANVLKKAASNASSGVRCSEIITDTTVTPQIVQAQPSFSFDFFLTSTQINTRTECVAKVAGSPGYFDFFASPVLDTKGLFLQTLAISESGHIAPAATGKDKTGATFNATCPANGTGWLSFRPDGVYMNCDTTGLPSNFCKLPVTTPNTPYCPAATTYFTYILHDDRNTVADSIITVSPTGIVNIQ